MIQIAVTLKLNKKLNRVDIVRTIVSHGWHIAGTIHDGRVTTNNKVIPKSIISVYTIRGIYKNKAFLVTYQPKLNEMTIVAATDKSEEELKNKIAHILERKKRGILYKDHKEQYLRGLQEHNWYLTDNEMDTLINEARTDMNSTLNYIA